jgi:hypothetical protein
MTQGMMRSFRTHMRRMRLGAPLAFGLALALAGCASITVSGTGAAGTSTPGAGASGTQGTLAGDVVAGPTCPVERAEDPCQPKAVPNREVQILGANSAVVATAMTDGKVTSASRWRQEPIPSPCRSAGSIGMRQMTTSRRISPPDRSRRSRSSWILHPLVVEGESGYPTACQPHVCAGRVSAGVRACDAPFARIVSQ